MPFVLHCVCVCVCVGRQATGVMFVLNYPTVVPVHLLSQYPGERELLLRPNTAMRSAGPFSLNARCVPVVSIADAAATREPYSILLEVGDDSAAAP